MEETQPQPVQPITWGCELSSLMQDKDAPLTVGDKMALICQGDSTKELLEKPLQVLVKDKADKYKLKILETRSIEIGRVDLVVTSYKPEDHSAVQFELKGSGKETVFLQIPNLKLTSVIEKKGMMQQPPPAYGPMMPLNQPLPWWYYAIWVTAIVMLSAYVIRKAVKYHQRRQLLENMGEFDSALGAFGQFNKDTRGRFKTISSLSEDSLSQEKAQEFIQNLKSDFNMYIVRELKIPAHIWSSKEVIKEIKKRYGRLFRKHGPAISKLIKEYDRTLKAQNISLQDCEQMIEMSKRVAAHVNEFKRRGAMR